MGDAENALPPSKKRAAGREISKDNPGLDDDEDSSEQEMGTFKRASEEVLASRRIVKVRRNPNTSAPSSNPFAGIRLVPPAEVTTVPAPVTAEGATTSEKVSVEGKNDVTEEAEKGKDVNGKQSDSKIEEPVAETAAVKESTDDEKAAEKESADDKKAAEKESTDDKKADNAVDEATKLEAETDTKKSTEDNETEKEKAGGGDNKESEDTKETGSENVDPSAEGAPLSSFQQLSSTQNAFTGLAGTGFSSSTFSFGSVPKDGSALGTSTGSLFTLKNDQPSFGFGLSNNGSSSMFNTAGSSTVSKGEGSGFPSLQEVTVETGEENERVVFSAESVLFEFLDGSWKERGKGELKLNVSTSETEKARVLMRTRGNYRLVLNANLYPDMKLTNMDKRGITFACVNSASEGKDGLSTFAAKFKDVSILEEFRAAVEANKGKAATVLKTPENSPKATDG
ncbi:hypothetical protein Tsubulata_033226 [Turnera subulata]|uniref:RanBD1 domain-containing protein n=1 Tax=Turnera subulata TaxID=218843 RepID=A0A9Q0J4P4_9ROSI|nr:hypothetical protein Tsubulata_033226 [Turnera subulata]